MAYTIMPSRNSLEDNRFKTISDFKDCIDRGGEVEIEWNGSHYGIIRYGKDKKITIYHWNQPETEVCFDSADDALEYKEPLTATFPAYAENCAGRGSFSFFGRDPAGEVSLLMDYTSRPGSVAAPWYTGDFEATWKDVEKGCVGLLESLRR